MLVRIVKNNPSRVFCFILLPAVSKRLYKSQVSVALVSSGKLFWESLLSPVPSNVTSGRAGRTVHGAERSCAAHSEDPSQGVNWGLSGAGAPRLPHG